VQDISVAEYLSLRALLAGILEDHLKGPIPEAKQLKTAEGGVTDAHRRWLMILDFCAPPEALRIGVTKRGPDDKTLITLLRYLHRMGRGVDHDRFDWAITYVFKRRLEKGELQSTGDIPGEVACMFPEFDQPPLSDHARQQLAALRAVQGQIGSFHDFRQLTQSGIIAKGREIKQSFGPERYHPAVLGAGVNYNLALGEICQGLLDKPVAPGESKQVEPPPSNARHGEVELEVTTGPETSSGYGAASVVDLAPEAAIDSGVVHGMTSNPKELAIDKKRESEKLAESVRNLVAFFEMPENRFETLACIGTLKVPLTDFEALAVQANFAEDDESFRAKFARGMKQSAALTMRMAEETEHLRNAPASSFFREVHQKALLWLFATAREHVQALHKLAEAAGKGGMPDKQRQVLTSAERLSATVDSAGKAV